MHGRGIKPFTKRIEDCRHQPSKQTVGGGSDYVKWLEDEPRRRFAALIAKPDTQTRAGPQEPKEQVGE